jgi:serine/threonine protein kinase/Tfp pilus assembly protein PilF
VRVAGPTPALSDADGESLLADLQDAFGSGAHSIRIEGTEALSAGEFETLPVAPVKAVEPGTRLGDFEIEALIGQGGMGVVFKARQISLNRIVALKVLAGFTAGGGTAIQRFRKEAQAAARLHHTNIVPIYAQGEYKGYYYYAMELIEGASLDCALRKGAFGVSAPTQPALRRRRGPASQPERETPFDAAADAFPDVTALRRTRDDYRQIAAAIADVADALEYAHQNGVIHRDIKPQNLLIGNDNRLHITDFGLAHLQSEPHLTVTGEVMGTPAFMSPEQIRMGHGRVDWRTDIYSLGVALYEVLTLRHPFRGETRDQVIDQICTREPRSPRKLDPRIPADLETICLRAMEKNRLRRYQSAGAMAQDLRRFAEGRPIKIRRTSPLAKALKWIRRHKARSTAAAAIMVALLLAVILTSLASARRREDANRLIQGAFEHLAYYDYHDRKHVQVDIDKAEAQGADPVRVLLTRAVSKMAGPDEQDFKDAIAHADRVIKRDPKNVEARCIKAAAYHFDGERERSNKTVKQVDALGGPKTAPENFFYALAIHKWEPNQAIRHYLTAIDLRRHEFEMYSQAMLHLARAQNQLLYKRREITPHLQDAEDNLRQLIRSRLYGAYPAYLLSISNRLSAEIYRAMGTEAGEQSGQDRYAKALDAAEQGIDADPYDYRPWTAKAECLESMGGQERLSAAIAARDEAIRIAREDANEMAQWENHHYRWRLLYWQGRLREALKDLDHLQQFADRFEEPEKDLIFYQAVYPSLVLAEQGQMDRALTLVRRICAAEPDNARRVLWTATGLRLLGKAAEARKLLEDRAATVDFEADIEAPQTKDWMRGLYALAQGQRSPADLLGSINGVERTLRGEAYFHAAIRELSTCQVGGVRGSSPGPSTGGDPVQSAPPSEGSCELALDYLRRAYQSFDDERGYTFHAKILLVKRIGEPSSRTWQKPLGPPTAEPGAAETLLTPR